MANLIFDYDGTLHDSIHIYAPAFRLSYEHLVQRGLAVHREWTNTQISYWLGYSAKDMWENFMPELSQLEKDFCSRIIGKEMVRFIQEGKARLYPNAGAVLQKLREEGHNLIFLSNCKRSYMQANREYFNLDQFFSAFYCTEDFEFAPKWQIFNIIRAKCSGNFLVIGDRWQDIEVATRHHLLSIGCTYGYGSDEELRDATIWVSSTVEILDALATVLRDGKSEYY